MRCPHNSRHVCRECKRQEKEAEAKRLAEAEASLRGTRKEPLPRCESCARGYCYVHSNDRFIWQEPEISKSKRRKVNGDLEWPGLVLEKNHPPEVAMARRLARGKGYRLGGVYSLPRAKPLAEGETVWHGTSFRSLQSIGAFHFHPSKWGMLGRGVYVAPSIGKAWRYCRDNLIKAIVACRLVDPGIVVDAGSFKTKEEMAEAYQDYKRVTFIAKRIEWSWGALRREEYCVKDPNQLALVCAMLFVKEI